MCQADFVCRARTFMRSPPDDPNVGLLLFDEPSAHLDPKAELGKLTIISRAFTCVYVAPRSFWSPTLITWH
jgi:ABC-type transport system involved in cytochrome bd biosynthesis fused ATPase/permease subunit